MKHERNFMKFSARSCSAAVLLLALALAASSQLATAVDDAGTSGASGYETYCSGCHQPGGEGMPGSFPRLAGAPFVVGDPGPLIEIVLKGRGVAMPALSAGISDAEVAALVTYVRTAWGNGAGAVTPADVAAARAAAR